MGTNKSIRRFRPMVLSTITILTTIAGCSPSDERLVGMAQQSLETQQRQNDAIARQSEAVVKESHELATAAGQLVSRDAEARQEMLQAQSQLNEQLHRERTGVDRQREQLETERRAVAQDRRREPILGAAIVGVGALLGCLTPLLLVAYALKQLGSAKSHSGDLAELLIAELTSAEPRLLSGWDRLPLRQRGPFSFRSVPP